MHENDKARGSYYFKWILKFYCWEKQKLFSIVTVYTSTEVLVITALESK